MKVIKKFYCLQEKKSYLIDDQYNGKRKDLKEYLEQPKVKKQTKK